MDTKGCLPTVLILFLAGCMPGQSQSAPQQGKALRVLFLGNSLTGNNDLPRIVQAMAASAGVIMEVDSLTNGGYSLEDHWNGNEARQKLAGSHWDYVVLQQGPSSRPESQVNLKQWAKKWSAEARKQGAEVALYMVWPFQGQANGFAQVSKSYRSAAAAADAKVFPAGEAWQAAIRDDSKIELFQPDNLHPTLAGSYLAALVVANGLVGLDVNAVPAKLKVASGGKFEVPEEVAVKLRKAAASIRKQEPQPASTKKE